MKLPAWLVLSPNGRPRWVFRNMRVIAGPEICKVYL